MKLKVFYAALFVSIFANVFAVGKIQNDFYSIEKYNQKYILSKEIRESFLYTQSNFRGYSLYSDVIFKRNTRNGYKKFKYNLEKLKDISKEDGDTTTFKLTAETGEYAFKWFRLAEVGFIKEQNMTQTEYIKYLKHTLIGAQKLRNTIQENTLHIETTQEKNVREANEDIIDKTHYLNLLIFFGTLSTVLSALAVGKTLETLRKELNYAKAYKYRL